MKHLIDKISSAAFIAVWLAGAVLASGFWSTLFAAFFPPWGWYLVAERLMVHWGWA